MAQLAVGEAGTLIITDLQIPSPEDGERPV